MAVRNQKNGFWRLQNQSKSSPEGFKIHPKSSSKALAFQKTPSNLNFLENYWFSHDFWTPKWSQNRRKTIKIRYWKTAHVWRRFSLEFSSFGPPKIDPTSSIFRIFIENVDFAKIIVFPKENCYFSNPEPQKMKQKSMPECDQNKYRKQVRTIWILASILGS